MNHRCSAVALSFSLLMLPISDAFGDSEEDEANNKSIIASIKPAKDDPEVMTLETWKSKVQGTAQGDKLIGLLTNLNSSIIRNHRDTNSLYTRGRLYGTVGCTNNAMVDLTKVIQADPSNWKAYCERGICYMDLGDYTHALTDLDKAVELSPTSGDARLARGRVQMWLGKPLVALNDLLAARYGNLEFSTSLPGELPANYYRAPDYYLGACYELLGNPTEALKYYKEATDLPSAHAPGYIHRYADQPSDVSDCVTRLGGSI